MIALSYTYSLAGLMLLVGVVLVISEMLLPTHGLLGVVGVGVMLGAVGVCMKQNPWVGLGLLVALALATPFALALALKIWPKTPLGRRILLPPIDSSAPAPSVRVGQAGLVISELRPVGLCEFAGNRIETLSEHGIVAVGTAVEVVALVNNRPTVRTIA